MRNAIVNHLATLAEKDSRIVLLTADLGFGVIESFRDRHPERFFNVGVSEQSMISTATGLAQMGMIPYCYSIATFATLRALEFLRNGPIAHSLPVRVIGVGPGFDYSNDGLTHYAVEDIASLRVMPNVLIWAPSDSPQLLDDFARVHNYEGLVYLRTPRSTHPVQKDRLFTPGVEACVVSFGDSDVDAQNVVSELKSADVQTDYLNCRWLANSPDATTLSVLEHYSVIVAVENHYIRGGFGSALLEFAAQIHSPPRIVLHGVTDLPVGALGDKAYLARAFMSNPRKTATNVARLLKA